MDTTTTMTRSNETQTTDQVTTTITDNPLPNKRSECVSKTMADTLVIGFGLPKVVITDSSIERLVICSDVEEIIITNSKIQFVSWPDKPSLIVIRGSSIYTPVPYADSIFVKESILVSWELEGRELKIKRCTTDRITVNQCEELLITNCPHITDINIGCDLQYMLCENVGITKCPTNVEEVFIDDCVRLVEVDDVQFVKGTIMDCSQLTVIDAPNAKALDCNGCTNLVDISMCEGLRYLNATNCHNLKYLPNAYLEILMIGNTKISKLPVKAYKLRHLNCGNTPMKDVSDLKHLTNLVISKSQVAHIARLPALKKLICRQSSELKHVDQSTNLLEFFNMVGCDNLSIISPAVKPNCRVKGAVRSNWCVIM